MRNQLLKESAKEKFRKFFNRLKKSTFLKNVLIVMSGTAAAQIIGFALTPVISRLYTPSDFGIFGSFNAVLSVIIAGVTLDYSQALMLPKKKEYAINLFMLSCGSTLIICVCCLIIYLIVPDVFFSILKVSSSWIVALLILSILVNGLNLAFQAWCVRCKAFRYTSASQVIRSLTSNGLQVLLGYFKGGPGALINSIIWAEVVASLNLLWAILPDLRTLRREITWVRMKKLAYEYRDFPFYSASKNIINALSQSLPVILLGQYYGIAVAGAYAFGVSLISKPMEFILRPLRQVLFQKASETYNEGRVLMPLYLKTTLGLFAVLVFPALIFLLWAPQIFVFIFGDKWQLAGEFARFLALWRMVMFCNLPSTLFSRIIRIQGRLFLFDLVILAARASTLYLGGKYLSEMNTIILFSMIGVFMNIILIFIVAIALKKADGYTVFTRRSEKP